VNRLHTASCRPHHWAALFVSCACRMPTTCWSAVVVLLLVLLLGSAAVAKVADLGLARVMDHSGIHRTTHTLGTINHMPPEQLRNGQLSPPVTSTPLASCCTSCTLAPWPSGSCSTWGSSMRRWCCTTCGPWSPADAGRPAAADGALLGH